MPAPVVADALGYLHVTTTRLAAQARRHLEPVRPGDTIGLNPCMMNFN
jgi:acyl dehydratase